MRTRRTILAFLAGILGPTASALSQSIVFINPPTGQGASYAQGVSADGRVVAGGSAAGTTGLGPGWTWTAAGGRNDFGLQSGLPHDTYARGISGDGGTVVGESGPAGFNGPLTAYRYQGPGAFQTLGLLSGYTNSLATGVSGDGSIVIGYNDRGSADPDGVAFRWTAGGGMQSLGRTPLSFRSEAYGISRSGSVIVGGSFGVGRSDGFTWTESAGIHALSPLPGTPSNGSTRAIGVNHDGSLIVGWSGAQTSGTLWRNGEPTDLGIPAGYIRSLASATSDDGSIVIGQIATGALYTAAIWRQETGWLRLQDYLQTIGVTIPQGYNLLTTTGISADGRVITGYTGTPSTIERAFVITIPAPGWAPLAASALPLLLRRRCRR